MNDLILMFNTVTRFMDLRINILGLNVSFWQIMFFNFGISIVIRIVYQIAFGGGGKNTS